MWYEDGTLIFEVQFPKSGYSLKIFEAVTIQVPKLEYSIKMVF